MCSSPLIPGSEEACVWRWVGIRLRPTANMQMDPRLTNTVTHPLNHWLIHHVPPPRPPPPPSPPAHTHTHTHTVASVSLAAHTRVTCVRLASTDLHALWNMQRPCHVILNHRHTHRHTHTHTQELYIACRRSATCLVTPGTSRSPTFTFERRAAKRWCHEPAAATGGCS